MINTYILLPHAFVHWDVYSVPVIFSLGVLHAKKKICFLLKKGEEGKSELIYFLLPSSHLVC